MNKKGLGERDICTKFITLPLRPQVGMLLPKFVKNSG